MSSEHFTIMPMAGSSGTTRISFRPTGNNDTHGDYVANAVVSDGSNSKSVRMTQYGIPTFSPASGGTAISFPSTGGTQEISVYSHYNFAFDFPSWITAQNGIGVNYASGQTIISSASTGGNWILTASPNTGNTSRTGSMTMYHYGQDILNYASATTTVNLSQAAGSSEPYFIVSPTNAYLDYYSGATTAFSVATNQQWGVQSIAGYFDNMISVTKNQEGNQAIVTNLLHNNSGRSYTTEVVFTASTSSSTNYVNMAYEPVFSSYSTSIGHSGGTFHINLGTVYNWWFVGLPSWITVTDTNDDVHYEQYNSPSNATFGQSLVLRGHVSENDTGNQRSATIRLGFRHYDNTTGPTYQQIIVTQSPAEDTIFVVPTPSAVTFNSAATSGAMQVIVVSANTSWSASWDDPSDNLFSLPYANTGSTGTTNLTVRYNGTSAQSASNTILLFNNGPTVRVPVVKQGDHYFNWNMISSSLSYTGGTVEFTLASDDLEAYMIDYRHGPLNAVEVAYNLSFYPVGSGQEWAWDYGTYYLDGVQVSRDDLSYVTGNNHTIRVDISMPSSVGEEFSYERGEIYLRFSFKNPYGSYGSCGTGEYRDVYIFGDNE